MLSNPSNGTRVNLGDEVYEFNQFHVPQNSMYVDVLHNGGFENWGSTPTTPPGWTAGTSGNGAVSKETVNIRTGSNAVSLDKGGAGAADIASIKLDLSAYSYWLEDATYFMISCWVKGDSAVANAFEISFVKGVGNAGVGYATQENITTAWHLVEHIIPIYSGVTTEQIVLGTRGLEQDYIVYVDDVTISIPATPSLFHEEKYTTTVDLSGGAVVKPLVHVSAANDNPIYVKSASMVWMDAQTSGVAPVLIGKETDNNYYATIATATKSQWAEVDFTILYNTVAVGDTLSVAYGGVAGNEDATVAVTVTCLVPTDSSAHFYKNTP